MLGGTLVRRTLLQKPLKSTILRSRLAVIGVPFSTSTHRLASLKVELKRNQPVVAIPLPSSGEVCEFTLPNTHSVKSFVDCIKEEDEGVQDALIQSLDGNRVAQTTRLSMLLTEGFNLKINDKYFTVQPTAEVSAVVNENSLELVRDLVENLYINHDVGGKKQYMFPEARNRQFFISFHKKAKRRGFDVEKYNHLRESAAKIEEELEQLNHTNPAQNEQL